MWRQAKQQKSSMRHRHQTRKLHRFAASVMMKKNCSTFGLSSEPGEIIASRNRKNGRQHSPAKTRKKKASLRMSKSLKKKLNNKQPELKSQAIEFHFENADLEILINQVSELFDVTFIADDSITRCLQGAKSVKGNKISFKTQRPLNQKRSMESFYNLLGNCRICRDF